MEANVCHVCNGEKVIVCPACKGSGLSSYISSTTPQSVSNIQTPSSNEKKSKAEITVGYMTLKLEQENAVAMTSGLPTKSGEPRITTIFTAHRDAWSMKNDFKHKAKLITPKVAPPREDYPLSIDGLQIQRYRVGHLKWNIGEKYPLKHIAILDTIFHINNTERIWKELCTNGTFDQWDWNAPFNSLKDKKNPMILVLRVCECNRDFRDEVYDPELQKNANNRFRRIRETTVIIVRPVIPNDRFSEIKQKVRTVLGSDLRREETCRDTNLLMQSLS